METDREEILTMDIGNGQSISLYYDTELGNPFFVLQNDANDTKHLENRMIFETKETELFIKSIGEIDLAILKIIGGEWDTVLKKELTEYIDMKVMAEKLPKVKIIDKSNVLRKKRYEIGYFQWCRLSSVINQIMGIIFKELQEYEDTYNEKSILKCEKFYRWRIIKIDEPKYSMKKEIFAGPWDMSLNKVIVNFREFACRMDERDKSRDNLGIFIDTMDGRNNVKCLCSITHIL